MQVTLTKVTRATHKKDGTAYINKNNRPYTRLSIQTQEHGGKWLSGFDNPQTANWTEGDRVEISVEEKGEYLNFSVPRPATQGFGIEDRDRLLRCEIILQKLLTMAQNPGSDYPANEMPDSPF